MSRGTWNKIKQSKFFYVKIYRRLIKLIMISVLLNVLLCLGVIYAYLSKPERDYYATSGEAPPIKLSALASQNDSSEPLLPPDPNDEDETRIIPE